MNRLLMILLAASACGVMMTSCGGEVRNREPVLSIPSSIPEATVGADYELLLQWQDPDGDSLTVTAQGLPGGLSLDTTAKKIVGKPNPGTEGQHNVKVTVRDAKGLQTVGEFRLTVVKPNTVPTIPTPIEDRKDVIGEKVDLRVVAADPDTGETLVYTWVGEPQGVTLHRDSGKITGILKGTAQEYDVVITVTDSRGATVTNTFLWTVSEPESKIDRARSGPGSRGGDVFYWEARDQFDRAWDDQFASITIGQEVRIERPGVGSANGVAGGTASGGALPLVYDRLPEEFRAAVRSLEGDPVNPLDRMNLRQTDLPGIRERSRELASRSPALTPFQVRVGVNNNNPGIGQEVEFTAVTVGGKNPITFDWNFGDGGTTVGNPVRHAYTAHSTPDNPLYTITVDAKDAGGKRAANNSVRVKVAANPLQVSISVDKDNAAVDEVVAFTAMVTGGISPVGVSWNFGDGTSGRGLRVSHKYSRAGVLNVVATVTDYARTVAASNTVAVTVTMPPEPMALVRADKATILVGDQVSFDGASSTGERITYEWSLPDGSTNTNSTMTFRFPTAGTFEVSLEVKDRFGRSDSNSVTITVTPPVVPPLDLSPTLSNTRPKVGEEVTFKITVSGGASPYAVNWDFGDGNSGTGDSVKHKYAAAGDIKVKVRVTDSSSPAQTKEFPPISVKVE